MLSYRGYGLSTGHASEVGIRIDAQTALDYVRNHPILKNTVVIAYGQSIGGAVAVDVASRNAKSVSIRRRLRREDAGALTLTRLSIIDLLQIHALILENTWVEETVSDEVECQADNHSLQLSPSCADF